MGLSTPWRRLKYVYDLNAMIMPDPLWKSLRESPLKRLYETLLQKPSKFAKSSDIDSIGGQGNICVAVNRMHVPTVTCDGDAPGGRR
jgi:hypothetical protein